MAKIEVVPRTGGTDRLRAPNWVERILRHMQHFASIPKAQEQPEPKSNSKGRRITRMTREQPGAEVNQCIAHCSPYLLPSDTLPNYGALPYLEAVYTAYSTRQGTIAQIKVDEALLDTLGLCTLAIRQQRRIVEDHANITRGRQECDKRNIKVNDLDTARHVREQDDRLRTLQTDVLERLIQDPKIVESEYCSGTTYEAHIRHVLADVYNKCKPLLDEQIQQMDKALPQ